MKHWAGPSSKHTLHSVIGHRADIAQMIRRSARGWTGDSTGTMDHRYDEPYMLTETILCDTGLIG